MTLAEFRKQYPQYGDMPDQELAERLHRRYYFEMPFHEFARRIGYTPPAPGPVTVHKRPWGKGIGLGLSCTLLALVTIISAILYWRQPAPQSTPAQDVFPVYFTARPGEHQQAAPLIFSPSELLRPPLIATEDSMSSRSPSEAEASQAGIQTESPSRPAAAPGLQSESRIASASDPGEKKGSQDAVPVSGENPSPKTLSQGEHQSVSKPAAGSQETRAADVPSGKGSAASAPAQEPAPRSPVTATDDSTPPGSPAGGEASQAATKTQQGPLQPAAAEVLQAESRIASDPAPRQPAVGTQATRATELPSAHPRAGMPEEAPGTHAVAAQPAPATAGPADPMRAATPPERGDSLFPQPGKVVAALPTAASGRSTAEPAPGKLAVRLEGPKPWVTESEVETVQGTIAGGLPVRLVLYVNGSTREVVASGGSFQANVSFQPGLNHIRVVATDWRGGESEDAITVEHIPPKVPNGIAITSPRDGHTLGPEDPPVIQVEGQVEDRDVHTVWLVVNGRRTAVQARHGRFRKAIPVLDRVVELRAEVARDSGPPRRSQAVTVRTTPPSPSVGFVLMEWPKGVVGHRVEVSATWRARPERFDRPVEQVPLVPLGTQAHDTPSEVFTIRALKPGVYTFVIEAHDVWASDVHPTLYLAQAGQVTARVLKSFSLMGRGKVTLARVLLPQGVLWEQNEWFTGQSMSADTTTKFRLPEGIVWKEREGNAE